MFWNFPMLAVILCAKEMKVFLNVTWKIKTNVYCGNVMDKHSSASLELSHLACASLVGWPCSPCSVPSGSFYTIIILLFLWETCSVMPVVTQTWRFPFSSWSLRCFQFSRAFWFIGSSNELKDACQNALPVFLSDLHICLVKHVMLEINLGFLSHSPTDS